MWSVPSPVAMGSVGHFISTSGVFNVQEGIDLVNAATKTRKRLTQCEALRRAREKIQLERVSPKPKRVTDDDSSGPRDRDRWVILPGHLASYAGELGVISQGHIWTYRVDRRAGWVDANGIKHYPDKGVYLGPVDALDPNYKRENNGPGQRSAEGDKTPGFVLGSEASGSRPPVRNRGGFVTPWWSAQKGQP